MRIPALLQTPHVVLLDEQDPAPLVTFEMFESQQTLVVNYQGPLVKSVIKFPLILVFLLTAAKANEFGMKRKRKDGN